MTRAKPEQDVPEAPAKVREGHVQDRLYESGAGAKVAWRNSDEHPLSAALNARRISPDEAAAGEVYRVFYELRARTGHDSTDLAVVSGGSGTPFTQTQVDAIRVIQQVEDRLMRLENGARFRIIVQSFCGEAWPAIEACRKAGYRNQRETWEHVRLALNKLATAIEGSRIYVGEFSAR